MASILEQETPGAEGGGLPFDVLKWLDDNKLSAYKDEFIKQQIDIEDLLLLTKEQLQTAAKDFGIKTIIHQNRFVKAVQKLIESSQKLDNNNNKPNNKNVNDKEPIGNTKEEQEILDKIELQMKKMTDSNNSNDYMIKNINIMSTKCENDINHLFDQLINSLKVRQKELITKTKQITNNKLFIINEQKIKINKYVNELQQFQTSYIQLMLNKNELSNEEPGQTVHQKQQSMSLKLNKLLQTQNINKNNLEININLTLTDKERENINKFISKIGYIYSNEPPNAPIIKINKNKITDNTAEMTMDFSNNNKLSLPTKYCVQMALFHSDYNNNIEEKKGEIDVDDIKIEWKEIVTNDIINLNDIGTVKYLIEDLKHNTKYLLQCKCFNKYGWSKFCKYISFITKDKIFRMDSNILNENEEQMFCENILINKLGKNKNEMNMKLLFRGSRDGFSADKFHSKCDGKKKTFVIIESNLGNVFGGYTKIAWSTDNKWHYDNNCFLFLCRNLKNNNKNNNKFEIYPIKQSCYSKAVKHYCSHGPCFGKGHDLLVVNAANITDSRSDGESFVNLKGNVLTGSVTQIHNKYWHFVVRDYEVFQLL